MTLKIVRNDKGPDGEEIPVLIGFTDDRAEAWVIIHEDQNNIDWNGNYSIEEVRD